MVEIMVRKREQNSEDSLSDDELYGFDEANDSADEPNKKRDLLSDEEVYGFGDSDDLGDDEELDDENIEDEEQDDFDMGSDIAEDEKVADDRAWGKSNRRFYNTDYVDQDYEGFYVGKEAEEAELEEQEAKQIQKRLVEQLNEADFDFNNLNVHKTSEAHAYEEIERDLSSLSKRQKLDLLRKESPEFFVLVDEFGSKLVEIDGILPVLNYLEKKQETSHAFKFLKKKFLILTNYCTNISFYLLLKAKGISVQNHPVLKSLFKYRKLLEQVEDIDKVINPQIEVIQRAVELGEEPKLKNFMREKKKKEKNILKLLSKSKLKKPKEVDNEYKRDDMAKKNEESIDMNIDESELHEEDLGINLNQEEGKRAITYEMAKNKGLMPKRNKDQRNPRVKHRKKYRKALIRRRGQVRTPRREIPVYGGEISGIKVSVTKSIKFK